MNRRNATLVLGALALGALGKTSRARASVSDPGPVFRLFAKSSGFSADFVEEKRIKLLKAPIVNHGRLYFSRPHQFARHVDAPFRAAMFLKDRELVLWDESGTRQIDLSKSPAVAALATSFLALLQGHHEPLAANYGIVFSGSAAGEWNLVLEPKPQALKRMVRQLAFAGTRGSLASMSVAEASGDSSHSRFTNVQANRGFSEREQTQYFTPPKQ